MPQTPSSRAISSDDTPCCDIVRAASAIVVTGVATTSSRRTSSPIGVMYSASPEESRGCVAASNRCSTLRMKNVSNAGDPARNASSAARGRYQNRPSSIEVMRKRTGLPVSTDSTPKLSPSP